MKTKTRRAGSSPNGQPVDEYYYGHRYVMKLDAQGRKRSECVPLTREDVLHPQEDDHISNNDPHMDDCTYLRQGFRRSLIQIPSVFVSQDLIVDWGVPSIQPMSPDVAVFFQIRELRGWSSLSCVEEGTSPTLVLEVTSPSTRSIDLHDKRRLYYRVGVPYYIIVDQVSRTSRPRRLRLLGYERGSRGYRRLPLNAQGRLWLETVQLWLGITGGRVALYDAQGNYVEDYIDTVQSKVEAEERALHEAEERRVAEADKQREAEARRVAEADKQREAEARRVAEADKQREAEARRVAEADKQREAEARRVAEADKQREAEARRVAEARVRELEEQLRRRQDG